MTNLVDGNQTEPIIVNGFCRMPSVSICKPMRGSISLFQERNYPMVVWTYSERSQSSGCHLWTICLHMYYSCIEGSLDQFYICALHYCRKNEQTWVVPYSIAGPHLLKQLFKVDSLKTRAELERYRRRRRNSWQDSNFSP